MTRIPCIPALALLLSACGAPFGVESNELPLVLTLPEYSIEADAGRDRLVIDYEIVNRTDRTLYARYSCNVIIERFEDGAWVHHWGGQECLLALERPTFLAAGEPERRELSVRIDEAWPQAEYRLRLDALSDELNGGHLGPNIPLHLRVSDPFLVAGG